MMGRVNRPNLMRLRVRHGWDDVPADLVEVWETYVNGWPVLVYAQHVDVQVGTKNTRRLILTCAEHGAHHTADTKKAAAVWAKNVDSWCRGCMRWADAEELPIGRLTALGPAASASGAARPTVERPCPPVCARHLTHPATAPGPDIP